MSNVASARTLRHACTLFLLLAASFNEVSAASPQPTLYGRWQFEPLGNHLPHHWRSDVPGETVADFSGLVGGTVRGPDNDTPHVFDVHAGELLQLSTEFDSVRDVDGQTALLGFSGRVYDHATGELQPLELDGRPAAIDSGRVLLDVSRNNGLTQFSEAVVSAPGEDARAVVPPFLREVAPGVESPIGELASRDIAGDWITGKAIGPEFEGSFVANIETGQISLVDGATLEAVNVHGQAAGRDGDGRPVLWDGEQLRGPLNQVRGNGERLAINAAGQIYAGFAIDDQGRVLDWEPGPLVDVPQPEGGFVEFPTRQLILGQPLFIEGDYDASGGVDQGDLNLVLLNWGRDAEEVLAEDEGGWVHDFAGGMIDQDELNRVLLNWGSSDGVLALPPGGVPEPSTALLLICAGVVPALQLLGRRNAKRHDTQD